MDYNTTPETIDDSTSLSQRGHLETPQVDETPDAIEQPSPTNDNDSDQPQKANAPLQKRRRVTRACDECRRKKIKCDGKQPCTHCTVYSYDCTYDQPSTRRRNAAPQYIESLEIQLKRAKAILNVLLPNLDLNDPSIDAHLQNGVLPQMPTANSHPQLPAVDKEHSQSGDGNADSHLVSMVRATGQLDLDEEGYWDYHGHSSGLSFIRKMREQFGDIIGPSSTGAPFVKSRPMSQVFDSPKSNNDSPFDSNLVLAAVDLPSRQEAKILCDNALNDASSLLKVMHLPTFYKTLDRIYDIPPENYGNRENTFLPLLYSVLALGTLFSKDCREIDEVGYENAIDEGFKYFKAARQLMDIADCRDLRSLQAVVFMILFLQSSAKLTTCYAYIGVALRSALRMGMHRAFNDNFNPIEAESRKRCFWVIRKMDTYVGAILGLPHTLNDEDIDQDLPTEVDDEYITETGILPMPEGSISVIAGSNAHTRIVHILGKIVLHIYPIKGTHCTGGGNAITYTVSYSKIREIEKDLQDWLDELPSRLKPGGDAPKSIIRVQQLLRMAYAHAQMMLYRPFLHYVSSTCKAKTVDQRAFACASACVSVSRNIVHITAGMKRQGLLIGAYWFSMYTTFFAILSLVFFALENPSNPTSNDVLRDAMEGKEVLAQLAKRSMAADRCTATLKIIFDQLPERLKRGREMATSKKRRQTPSPQPPSPKASSSLKSDPDGDMTPRRANTFPVSLPNTFSKSASFPHSLAISQSNQLDQLAPLSVDSPFQNLSSQPSLDCFDPLPSLTLSSTTTSILNGFTNLSQQQQSTPAPRSSSSSSSSSSSTTTATTTTTHSSFPATPIANSFLDSTGFNVPLPDMSAMMFPSADPFAYPNQPMTTFENTNLSSLRGVAGVKDSTTSPTANGFSFRPGSSGGHVDVFGSISGINGMGGRGNNSTGGDGNGNGNGNGSEGGNGLRLSDTDVQLFGPMPMYLMQGAHHHNHHHQQNQQNLHNQQHGHLNLHNANINNATANHVNGVNGVNCVNGVNMAGVNGAGVNINGIGVPVMFEGSTMNLDDLFSGEEWADRKSVV